MSEKVNSIINSEIIDDESLKDMYLTFSVESEEYAVCIENVTEIVTNQRIIPAPDVPEYIAGVINLRGKVIPLMDVRLRFGLKQKEYDDRTCIIVVEIDNVPTGLMVDSVKDVLEIQEQDIEPPKYGKGKGIIEGLGKREENVNFIINLPHLLAEKEINLEELKEVTGTE